VEIYQLALAATVGDTGPVVVVGLVDLQQVQPLQLAGGMVERAALF
jgi:ABC-type transporter Mla maintaining outer membrane lipid asymmetry ATPase subunit MlaF